MENLKNSELKERIRIILGVSLILILAGLFVFNLLYIEKLENQIKERDDIIKDLTFSDSLLNKVMDVEYDSVTKNDVYSYRLIDGKVLKYNTVIKELDKSSDKYDKLIDEYNSLANKYDLSRDSLSSYKIIVELINRKYNIKHKIGKEYISIEAKQLDSALVLLPYFRERLSIEGNKWVIETIGNK